MFVFWKRWLIALFSVFIVIGVLISAVSLFHVNDSLFSTFFWPGGEIPTQAKLFTSWVYGEYGALLIAFGILMLALVLKIFDSKEKWIWRAIVVAFTLWLAVVSASALSHGFYLIFWGNTIGYVLVMLPLVFTYKNFNS